MPMLILLLVVGVKHNTSDDMIKSMLFGYANMLLAFTMIFFGVHSYKKKQLNGSISFGRALWAGLIIAFIASTIYVVAWVVLSKIFYPEFVDDFLQGQLHQLEASKLSADQILKEKEDLLKQMEFYRTVPGMVLFTYFEILIIGIPMALISAIVFSIKKRKKDENTDAVQPL